MIIQIAQPGAGPPGSDEAAAAPGTYVFDN
jgi:hypothetical protein